METGKIAELMLLWDIKDKIPTAQEVAKAIVEEEAKRREDEKAYWEAWDKAFKEGILKQLYDDSTAGLKTAKTLGVSREGYIRAIENGEIKLLAIIEPSVIGSIPLKSLWKDETRAEAQQEEYRQYLQDAMGLAQKYQHRIVL